MQRMQTVVLSADALLGRRGSRGAGDIIGRRQSGRDSAAALRVARLPADRDLLEAARTAAARALARYGPDPAAWPPTLLAAMRSQART